MLLEMNISLSQLPCPKYLLSLDSVIRQLDTGRWLRGQIFLTEGSSVNKENPQQMFPVVVVVWISITVLPVKIINPKKEGILDMAQGNVHFQQHAWGYYAFKHFVMCSDDGSLPLV